MKITVNRSGGFSGITLPSKVLETDDEEIKTLARLVVANYPAPVENPEGADMMQYDLTVEEDGKVSNVRRVHELDNEFQKLIKLVIG